jgi:hypothetical protein
VTPAPYSYELNRISSAHIIDFLRVRGLQLAATYRYNLPLPGMARVFSDGTLYRIIVAVHGRYSDNRRASLGGEWLMHFRRA